MPKIHCRGSDTAQAIAPNLLYPINLHDDSGRLRHSGSKMRIQYRRHTRLPAEHSIHRRKPHQPRKKLFMSQIEQTVHSPIRPSIRLKFLIVNLDTGRLPKQISNPIDQHTPPDSPQREIIPHVCLELC